ncbi:hypothetical protein LTR60_004374, partial [Cryomyces antarcticus]
AAQIRVTLHTSTSIPMPPYNGPRRVPRPMDLILVLLQPNQPPAAHAHCKARQQATKHHPRNRCPPATARDCDADSTSGARDEEDGEGEVAVPRDVAQVPAEDGEEAKDFDREEREREDVRCGWEAGGEDCGGHEGCVG